MKIIDLLNRIANGEKVPKRIKYNGTIYEKFDYNNKYYDIESNSKETDILSKHLASESFYNDEVEIIEEDKKIKRIGKLNQVEDKQNLNNYMLRDKINEIIDYLNKEREQ